MAHERRRHIDEMFLRLMGFSPIAGIFGHRQVGKSTFLASQVDDYRTLDDLETFELVRRSPKDFVQSLREPPMAIDECQLEPKLFPTLKEWVRTHKKPGQFVLSGSVRFTSRKAIRESLAGRIALMEMLPFSVGEIAGEPLSDVISKFLYHKNFSQNSLSHLNPPKLQKMLAKHFVAYLENGGLPGLCFVRNPLLQRNALNDLHELILARDLRLVSEIRTPVATLKKLLSLIAKQGFTPYIAAEVKRSLGLAIQTQRKILDGLEAIFLIRRISVPHRKKEIILLEDQLEELVYAGSSLELAKRLETAVYRNIRTQFFYRLDKDVRFESYLTRDHARVPIVVRTEDHTLGIIVHAESKPTLSEMRSGASFLRTYANAKMIYLSHGPKEAEILDERSIACAIAAVL